ncbi:MAG: prepilin-type N-terminal cleavage/methylation domain-containing protein [Candidatus Omnitrophota bacterium]
MQINNSYRGMTLVEIIVVVAVIAVLAALIIPPMHYAKIEAQKQACYAQVVALNAQIESYQAQQGSWPVALSNLTDLDYIDKLPKCPFGEEYIYNISAYRVMQHTH